MYVTIAEAVKMWNEPQRGNRRIADVRDFAHWLHEGKLGEHDGGARIIANPDISVSLPEDSWLIPLGEMLDAATNYVDEIKRINENDIKSFSDFDPFGDLVEGLREVAARYEADADQYQADEEAADILNGMYGRDEDEGLTPVECELELAVAADFRIELGYENVRDEVATLIQGILSEAQSEIEHGVADILNDHGLSPLDDHQSFNHTQVG